MPMVIGVVAGIAVGALLALIGVFKMMWRVAEPNEALIISGSKHKTEGLEEGMGFRIVTGRGTLVLPGVQAVRKLSLDLNETELHVDCVTHQGIPLKVRGWSSSRWATTSCRSPTRGAVSSTSRS